MNVIVVMSPIENNMGKTMANVPVKPIIQPAIQRNTQRFRMRIRLGEASSEFRSLES